jgi:folate-binding protein YgfZ
MAGFTRKALAVIKFTGKDSQDFLQRITSQDFKNWEPFQQKHGAFLNHIGGTIATFLATQIPDGFLLVFQKGSLPRALQQVEKMLFSEDLTYKEVHEYSAMEMTSEAEDDYRVLVDLKDDIDAFAERLKQKSFVEYDEEAWKNLKIKNFQPLDQTDLNESNIILEAGLESFVHRNKGCYPGQEVVERIYTYGNIPRKFVQLISSSPLVMGDIFLENQKVGRVTSVLNEGQTFVANGYMLRAKSSEGTAVEVKNSEQASVKAIVSRVSPDLHKDAAAQ